MKRSKHTLSHYTMRTCNMGELIPLTCVPVLPGDTFQQHTSALVRLSPLNTPVMHPTAVRIHHWFVPYRIIVDEWEDFITGGPNGVSTPSLPTVTLSGNKKGVTQYCGIAPIQDNVVSAIPMYAYNKIVNENYRDQDIIAERPVSHNGIFNIAWERDSFTDARPWSQKGPDVRLPIGTSAPVSMATPGTPTVKMVNQGGADYDLDSSGAKLQSGASGAVTPVPLTADLQSATGVSINEFRQAFAIQRYQEARARYGSRFVEYLRYLGVNPSDQRLQRPEFLGGGTQRLQFSEVLQTAETTTEGNTKPGVGDMYGHGIAAARTNRYRKFFEEHGVVMTLLSIRPKAMYLNGNPREWMKTTKEDFFQKELANLGQQEVWEGELYASASNNKTTFGYQDRYQEYRRWPSNVAGDFRDTLNAYHMGRDLTPSPVLNQDFIDCKPSDRIFQVGEGNADTCWIMANHHITARRLVPKRANPRIL